MSLIINDKKVAGLYKAYVIQNATNTASGIIRIATEEEVKAGLDSLTAVTPKQLATKQDVLIAGNGLEILEDGTINNTQTSAEWGNIIGNILDQEDLNAILLTKANEEETAYELVYENSILTLKNRKGDTLSEVSINELPDVDNTTIIINEENNLQAIGEKTKSGTFKYTWIGTEEQYIQDKELNIIDEFTECIIIDSEAEKVVPIVQYQAPTKLSELANDIEYVTNDELQSVKTSLENKIDLQTDGAEIVHRVGNETIDGFKNFKQKIVIENGLGKGRIAHKPVDTSLEDGYIEFGDNTLLYGKQNINGELYDEKHDIFHAGNLVAGDNITITENNGVYSINGKAGGGTGGGSIDNVDNETIIIQDDGSISAQGVLDQNAEDLTAIKFWSGTLEEYEALGEWDNNTIYNVTDDVVIQEENKYELPIASTDTLGGVKVDGKTIKVTEEGVISSNGGGGLEIGDIGIAPLGIDETKGKRRYLNGQVIIQEQYVQFTNKVKLAVALYPSLACTESEWQTTATMTVGGQVGKFVVDDDAGTIRLPKIIMPIQGLTDLSKLGEIVEAGLPNITGETGNLGVDAHGTGAFARYAFSSGWGNYTSGNGNGSVDFDASRCSEVYGNSNTVQQEAIQYPYFIQVATGAETEDNIINEIELNNPYSFGDSKYSPKPLNNLSWLKSEGQYNPKATYPSYYDWALINANNGVEGFKFITDEYTDYDVVINSVDETFRLPLFNGSESILSNNYDELTLHAPGTFYTAPANGWYSVHTKSSGANQYINIINQNNLFESLEWSQQSTDMVCWMPCKKGDVVKVNYTTSGGFVNFRFFYAQGNGSLYFYVGEIVQNANLINAGRIEEKLINKANTNASNFTADGKSLISSYAMPSKKTFNLAVGANGSTYTAPANGYFRFWFQTSTANNYQYGIINTSNDLSSLQRINANGVVGSAFVPVAKGDVVQIIFEATLMSVNLKFIYAVGSESEAQ